MSIKIQTSPVVFTVLFLSSCTHDIILQSNPGNELKATLTAFLQAPGDNDTLVGLAARHKTSERNEIRALDIPQNNEMVKGEKA